VLWWLAPAAWAAAVGLGGIAADRHPAVLVGVALVGAVVTHLVQRRGVVRPLERLRDELEARRHGRGGAAARRPSSGIVGAIWSAAGRLEAPRTDGGAEAAWRQAAHRLDAFDADSSGPAEPVDQRFEAALQRLAHRFGARVHGLHRSSREVAEAGVRSLDLLRQQQGAWSELVQHSSAWWDRAQGTVERLGEASTELEEAKAALDATVATQAEAERRLEATLRSAAARLARIVELEAEIRGGQNEIERLERSIATSMRSEASETQMARLGEAQAIVAHIAESQAAWAAEAGRARDMLESLADLIPNPESRARIDAPLYDALNELDGLARSWADYLETLRRARARQRSEPSALDDAHADLRRALSELGPLLSETGVPASVEDTLLERLRTEAAQRREAEASPSQLTRETQRTLSDVEAMGERARARLDALVDSMKSPTRDDGGSA